VSAVRLRGPGEVVRRHGPQRLKAGSAFPSAGQGLDHSFCFALVAEVHQECDVNRIQLTGRLLLSAGPNLREATTSPRRVRQRIRPALHEPHPPLTTDSRVRVPQATTVVNVSHNPLPIANCSAVRHSHGVTPRVRSAVT